MFPDEDPLHKSILIKTAHVYRSKVSGHLWNKTVFNLELKAIRKAALSLNKIQQLTDSLNLSLKRKAEGEELSDNRRRRIEEYLDSVTNGLGLQEDGDEENENEE